MDQQQIFVTQGYLVAIVADWRAHGSYQVYPGITKKTIDCLYLIQNVSTSLDGVDVQSQKFSDWSKLLDGQRRKILKEILNQVSICRCYYKTIYINSNHADVLVNNLVIKKHIRDTAPIASFSKFHME